MDRKLLALLLLVQPFFYHELLAWRKHMSIPMLEGTLTLSPNDLLRLESSAGTIYSGNGKIV